MPGSLPSRPFGSLPDGQDVTLWTLQNETLRVGITDFGGRVVSVEAPDRHGMREHVLLGFESVEGYQAAGSFGTLLGRYANRIAGGSIEIDGQTYALSQNEGGNTLHGGAVGFSKAIWTASPHTDPLPALVLTHVSPDGDQGFPGELTVQATYQLEADALVLRLEAHTTAPTVINLSIHPYFNLGGPTCASVLDHELTIASDAFLPTDTAQIPTGEIRPVAGTPFDFRQASPIGARIRQPDPQILAAYGYDHCFALQEEGPAMHLHDPVSGRVLEIETDQPGLQVYTANKLLGAYAGHGGLVYRQSAGLALEPQDFPDAPHNDTFPSTILRPEMVYRRFMRYRFSVA